MVDNLRALRFLQGAEVSFEATAELFGGSGVEMEEISILGSSCVILDVLRRVLDGGGVLVANLPRNNSLEGHLFFA